MAATTVVAAASCLSLLLAFPPPPLLRHANNNDAFLAGVEAPWQIKIKPKFPVWVVVEEEIQPQIKGAQKERQKSCHKGLPGGADSPPKPDGHSRGSEKENRIRQGFEPPVGRRIEFVIVPAPAKTPVQKEEGKQNQCHCGKKPEEV